MIDTRAREARRRALLEVEAIEVPEAETVIARRRARQRARVVRTSAAVVVLITLISGVAVLATREHSTTDVAIGAPPSTTVSPSPAGLVLKGFHARKCNAQLFQAVYGCAFETHSGTSSDVAASSVRDGTNGWVVDLTLTPAAAARFEPDTIISASVDGVHVNAARGKPGTLVLAGAGITPWDAATATSIAVRIVETR